MTRREPVSARAIAQGVVVVVTLVAVAAVLAHLHVSAPDQPLASVLEGVTDQRGGQLTFVSCQRTLPDRPVASQISGRVPSAVGLVRSSEVVACPDVFDPAGRGGPPVEFIGEVVGDVLRRDGGAWVLLNDDPYALEQGPLPAHTTRVGGNTGLTVWLPADTIDRTELEPGRHGRRGDVLRVEGRILRTDPADGGGLTLRAVAAEVLVPATPAPVPPHPRQAAAAAILGTLAALLIAFERRAAATR